MAASPATDLCPSDKHLHLGDHRFPVSITGSWPGSSCCSKELVPTLHCASHFEARFEEGGCARHHTGSLPLPNLPDAVEGAGRWGQNSLPCPHPARSLCGTDSTPSSALLPLLPPPPGTQNCFSSLLMLLTKGLRSKAACHRPDLEKHRLPPHPDVSLGKRGRGKGI